MLYRLLSYLPLGLLYALGTPCYLLLYHVAGYRKAVVLQNLRQAFPEKARKRSQFWQRNSIDSWWTWPWKPSGRAA